MNNLTILNRYYKSSIRLKKYIFLNDGFYSQLIDYSIGNFIKIKILFFLRNFFYYLKKRKNRNRILLLKLNSNIKFIRGNVIEKSLVIIEDNSVTKFFEPTSTNLYFYKECYSLIYNRKEIFNINIPKILSIEVKDNHLIIKFEKINQTNETNNSLVSIANTSQRLSNLLSQIGDKLNLNPIEKLFFSIKEIEKYVVNIYNDHTLNFNISHGDFWHGNILHNNNQFYIIDFENLTNAPIYYDLVYYILTDIAKENKNFFFKVLKNEKIIYSKIDELKKIDIPYKYLVANELIYFSLKFNYNLKNNSIYKNHIFQIIKCLDNIINGKGIMNNILNNE